eukprot:3346960-Pleurochrysis_carterae.AAC.2
MHYTTTRQNSRIRRKRTVDNQREASRTKSSTEIDCIRRERPASLRCVPPSPREGRQWVLEVPLQGIMLAEPEQPSREECAQHTRGRAGAHAGPELALVFGRNRHEAGKGRHRQRATSTCIWLMATVMCA